MSYRQKTGTHISNWIPAWLGEELLAAKNGNPKYFFWNGTTTAEDAPSGSARAGSGLEDIAD